MRDIKELSLKDLEGVLASWKEPGFRARQIFTWIYQKDAQGFAQMSDLSVSLRKKLQDNFTLCGMTIITHLESRDGTEKFLFSLSDHSHIEGVVIPVKDRLTGCLSTQVGCKFSCRFCASGLSGFKRNLTSPEILDQVLLMNRNNRSGHLTHIVFMGTGEPFDNYDNLMKAIRVINSRQGLNIGARRITISTAGVIPGINRLAQEGLQVELSVSLHAAVDLTRSQLMSINKKYPLKELLGAASSYYHKTNRQVTFEYILIKDLNSDLQSAKKLATIMQGFDSKVNIIPANQIKECSAVPPGKLEILLFRNALLKAGINVTLRKSRGEDIDAACGQLRLRYEKR